MTFWYFFTNRNVIILFNFTLVGLFSRGFRGPQLRRWYSMEPEFILILLLVLLYLHYYWWFYIYFVIDTFILTLLLLLWYFPHLFLLLSQLWQCNSAVFYLSQIYKCICLSLHTIWVQYIWYFPHLFLLLSQLWHDNSALLFSLHLQLGVLYFYNVIIIPKFQNTNTKTTHICTLSLEFPNTNTKTN